MLSQHVACVRASTIRRIIPRRTGARDPIHQPPEHEAPNEARRTRVPVCAVRSGRGAGVSATLIVRAVITRE
jgi:hypothetical protein